MLKKSLKYLAVAVINFLFLFLLLFSWVDALEVIFDSVKLIIELFKLIGMTLLGILVLGIASFIFRKLKITSVKRKIALSFLILILMNSLIYVDYGKKVYYNKFVNKELRSSVAKKVESKTTGWKGTTGKQLTIREYQEILKVTNFPEIPEESENISYDYEWEGFLPDYSFDLVYHLPLDYKIDTMQYKSGTFSKNRTVEIVGNKKRVTHTEYLW